MNGEQYAKWVEDNLGEDLAQFHIQKKKLEQQREKLQANIAEIKERHVQLVREEIVKAWMRKEENQWQNQCDELTKIFTEMLKEHQRDLEQIRRSDGVPVYEDYMY